MADGHQQGDDEERQPADDESARDDGQRLGRFSLTSRLDVTSSVGVGRGRNGRRGHRRDASGDWSRFWLRRRRRLLLLLRSFDAFLIGNGRRRSSETQYADSGGHDGAGRLRGDNGNSRAGGIGRRGGRNRSAHTKTDAQRCRRDAVVGLLLLLPPPDALPGREEDPPV